MEDDIKHCKEQLKTELKYDMLTVENKLTVELTTLRKDVEVLNASIAKLVTQIEFGPVKMITFGLAGGVMIAAMGAILGKVLGW